MARFFVGQRVRLVRASNTENNGIVGAIVRFEFCPKGTRCIDGITNIDADCVVKYDGDSCARKEHTSRLEPITDANDLVSWESMRDLWVPEHLREDA